MVKKILDGVSSSLKLKGYVVFEDNWITDNDKVLYNQNNVEFSVLDFEEIVENTLSLGAMPYQNGWRESKFSCVKLDKAAEIGDIFYTYI